VLVLDAESHDRTVQIARDFGADTIVRPWTDFVEARRFALGRVRTPWTFMLDADERLDGALRDAIERLETEADRVDGYVVRRATHFCGQTVQALGWGDERLLRIFRSDRAALTARPATGGGAPIHERWIVPGATAELPGVLVHESYPSRAAYRRKFSRYTSLEARGITPSVVALLAACAVMPLRLAHMLLARGALGAGWRGLYLAFWSASYPVAVRWKALRRSA
jgi:glycosyltransferase involved in cell wall biosynthesis